VGRDAKGVYAYSNVCTHQGGRVPAPDASGVSKCCLHGSKYDVNGDVIAGITTSQNPLPHYEVRLEGSGIDVTVVVNLSAEVTDRKARLAL
jgi:Rieske Fe-S protein